MKLIYSTKKVVYYKFLFNQNINYNQKYQNLIIKYENSVIYNQKINLTTDFLDSNRFIQNLYCMDSLCIRTDINDKIRNIQIIHKGNKLYYYDFFYSKTNHDDITIKFS